MRCWSVPFRASLPRTALAFVLLLFSLLSPAKNAWVQADSDSVVDGPQLDDSMGASKDRNMMKSSSPHDPSLRHLADLIEASPTAADDDSSDATSGGLVYDIAVDAPSRDPAAQGTDSQHSSSWRRRQRPLLRASGVLRNGRVCGLLGPSGSGKTTFLSSLLVGTAISSSSKTPSATGKSGLNRTGHIWLYQSGRNDGDVNAEERRTFTGTRRNPKASRRIFFSPLHPSQVAYLQQQDEFFELLTVRETLELAAFFELPSVDADHRSHRVKMLLDSLGLSGVSSNWIGNAYNPHLGRLSGGERRRLSVALELVTPKALLVADEPTTGLDSTLSVQVMKLIRNLTIVNQIPTVVSLHQPRSSIFHEHLDDCILMASGGRVCYAGDAEGAVPYFARLGYTCPPATNPAEFLVDLVSVDPENVTQAAIDKVRIDALVAAFISSPRNGDRNEGKSAQQPFSTDLVLVRENFPTLDSGLRTCPSPNSAGPSRWLTMLGALLRRSWRQNVRNRTVNLFRAVASVGNAYILSLIFPTVRGPQVRASSVADRVALLSFGAINQCMMAYMKTAELFSKERPVVRREQIRQQYSVLSYLLAKIGGELLLDAMFAAIFTTTLKCCTGIRITWKKLTAVYSLLTAAGGSLGFAIGSWTPSDQLSTTVGIPILVILMVVGVINPSGVDPSNPPPKIVQLIKQMSPFASCIEGLCLGEYPGMKFAMQDVKGFGWFRRFSNLPRMGGLALVRDGDQVVEALGLKGRTFVGSVKHLSVLIMANLVLSWMGLLYHQRRSTPGSHKMNGSTAKFRNDTSASMTQSRGQSSRPTVFSSSETQPVAPHKIRMRY